MDGRINEWMNGWMDSWQAGAIKASVKPAGQSSALWHSHGQIGSELGGGCSPQASAMLEVAAKPVAGEFHDD